MFKKVLTHTVFSFIVKNKVASIVTLAVIISSLGGFAAGRYFQETRYTSFLKGFQNIREDSGKYDYINPLIGSISPPATSVGIFADVKDEVVSYLAKEAKKEVLYGYSFYFRDLGTGLWFGTNENADFFPASLFKLPIAIAIYKQGEDVPEFLKKKVLYTKEISDINDSVQANSKSSLTVGAWYSVDELVRIMLIESDNGAKNLLLSVLENRYIDNLFTAVSLVDPSKAKSYTVSSRQYALFLRILYGSSYLNEEHSEYLMKILAETKFDQGMVAGLPRNIKVAHKYGVYEFEESVNGVTRNAEQLHDCGIVYDKEKPYIFCLMTKGKDLEDLYRIISHVSELIYKNQQSEYQFND